MGMYYSNKLVIYSSRDSQCTAGYSCIEHVGTRTDARVRSRTLRSQSSCESSLLTQTALIC